MRLEDAENAAEIAEAVEAEDDEMLEDIKKEVRKEVISAFENGEELSLQDNYADNEDAYWQALYEVGWEQAIDEAWGLAAEAQGATSLLNSENEALNEWLWDQAHNELGREVTQPDNYHENAYVDLTHEDKANEDDVAPARHLWIDIEPRKRRMEFTVGWPLDAVPSEVLDEIVEGEAWDHLSADVQRHGQSDTFTSPDPVEVEDEVWVLDIDLDALAEFIGDKAREWISEVVDKDPGAAVAMLVEAVESKDPSLARKLAKAKLPQEVLASLAVSYFADDDIELIRETVGEFGYTGSRGQPMLHVTRADLAGMGITGGRLWDGAPWTLVNLPSNELGYEGVRQRHCVGRHDMGYREAVDRGRIWVWSLRSQYNKPLLTWEVDRRTWENAQRMEAAGDVTASNAKGSAIRQLKGKLNRLAGKDDDEAAVLLWIFARMGVDERMVRDFNDAYKRRAWSGHGIARAPGGPHDGRVQGNPSFNRPWRGE